jgi:hypothetical protein
MEWISRFRHASRNWELGMNRLRSLSDLKDGVVESPFVLSREKVIRGVTIALDPWARLQGLP